MFLFCARKGDERMYFNQSAFGKRVKEARKERGLSQAGMAERLNISTNHYGHMEQGIKGCSIAFCIIIGLINLVLSLLKSTPFSEE